MRRLVVLLAVALLVLVACDPPPLASPGSGGSDVTDIVDPSVVGTPQGSFVSEDWHHVGEAGEPAFLNSYTDTFPAVFRLREAGILDLAGYVTGGTAEVAVFQLPAGYRPSSNTQVSVSGDTASQTVAAYLVVDTDGYVFATRTGTDLVGFCLNSQIFLNSPA